MRADYIELWNFRSVDHVRLNYSDCGLYVVTADNRESLYGDSNGAGKSTLFVEALGWVWFGKSIRDLGTRVDKDAVTSDWIGKDTCVETGATQEDGTLIVVRRYRNHSTQKNLLQLIVNHVDVTKSSNTETQIELERLLGYDFVSFSCSVLHSMSGMRHFTQLDDNERKNVRDKILGLDRYAKAYLLANQRRLDCVKILSGLNAQIATAMRLRDDKQNYLEREQSLDKAWKETTDQAIAKLHAQIDEIDHELEKLPSGTVEQANRDLNEKSQRLGEVKGSISVRKQTLAMVQNSVSTASKMLGKPCPTCSRTITENEFGEFIENKRKEIEILQTELENLAGTQQSVIDHQTQASDLTKKLKRREELQAHQSRLKDSVKQIPATSPHAETIARLQQESQDLDHELQSFQTQTNQLADQISVLQFWEEGFGPEGIRSLLLDEFLPYFDSRLKYYSEFLTEGQIRTRLATEKELKSGAIRDKMDVVVENLVGGKSYVDSSDGERQRLDVIYLFAWADLAALRGSSTFNFMVLDEVFGGGLDSLGTQRLAALLEKISHDRTVYVITHDRELLGLLNAKRIHLIRENRHTSLEQ